jgi:hypothetical protein
MHDLRYMKKRDDVDAKFAALYETFGKELEYLDKKIDESADKLLKIVLHRSYEDVVHKSVAALFEKHVGDAVKKFHTQLKEATDDATTFKNEYQEALEKVIENSKKDLLRLELKVKNRLENLKQEFELPIE